jgi:hypothetical protein
MTIETLAEKFRLKITRDECNDKIIEGRHGHLYVDAGQICAMWLDAPITLESLRKLNCRRIWVGDFSLEGGRRQRRLRDGKAVDIPHEQIPLAIRLTGVKRKRIMSEAQRAALEKASAASPLGRPKEKL